MSSYFWCPHQKLNPDFGTLYPEGFKYLSEAKDEGQIYAYLEKEFGDTFGALIRDMRKDEGTVHIYPCAADWAHRCCVGACQVH